eukprot:1572251-Pyramimonas_sp.AAC.1
MSKRPAAHAKPSAAEEAAREEVGPPDEQDGSGWIPKVGVIRGAMRRRRRRMRMRSSSSSSSRKRTKRSLRRRGRRRTVSYTHLRAHETGAYL